ncbi:Bax inhibitor-1 family protein [Mycoplasmoides pirum]|uniref:Bax inhibitor-1 family protein n=1 Tax=Mycoplasmoides pirum TaxID=2122 RepID=UPI00048857D6|nr:Bax inhibitor-1 family protein [Mycoplasmoides pirum]
MNYNDTNYSFAQGKWVFRQEQSKLLTRSFLYTGFSFVAIFVISFLIYYLLPRQNPSIADNFLIISPILIFISTIMGMFLRPKMTGGMGFTVFVYLFYIIAQSLGFGGLFYAIDFSNQVGINTGIQVIDVAAIFGVAGLMFVGMAIVGASMSKKSSIKFGRFLFGAVIAWLFASIVFSITIFFATPNQYNWIIIVSSVVGGLINLGYIAFIVSQIKASSDFVDFVGNKTLINTMAASYGFWMLVSLVGLVWYLVRLLFIFKS